MNPDGPAETPFGSILTVCTANVCRSPLAARTLRRRLIAGGFDGVDIGSAGTRALEGEPMCEVSACELPPDDSDYPAMHRARQLEQDLVRDADLVLTLEREHRSAAVRAAPGSQAKVFTLREADALLGLLAEREREHDAIADLPSLARAMHSVRGLVPMTVPEPVKKHWWSRPVEPEDPMTIVDGHGLSAEEHTAAADQVRATAERVGTAIVALTTR